MSTLPELITHRDTAGARYVAAVAEFRAAFADLAAIEQLLMSSNVRGWTIETFGGPAPDMIPMRHLKYLPGNGGMLYDDVKARFAIRAAAFGTPDEE